jgi:hypothetical protein
MYIADKKYYSFYRYNKHWRHDITTDSCGKCGIKFGVLDYVLVMKQYILWNNIHIRANLFLLKYLFYINFNIHNINQIDWIYFNFNIY